MNQVNESILYNDLSRYRHKTIETVLRINSMKVDTSLVLKSKLSLFDFTLV